MSLAAQRFIEGLIRDALQVGPAHLSLLTVLKKLKRHPTISDRRADTDT